MDGCFEVFLGLAAPPNWSSLRHSDQQDLEAEALQACLELMVSHLDES